jgi:hypothetical protein
MDPWDQDFQAYRDLWSERSARDSRARWWDGFTVGALVTLVALPLLQFLGCAGR